MLENLSKRPVTRMYPRVERRAFENNRGQLENNIGECVMCGLCQRVCPSKCIKVERSEKKWEYNPFECILCGVCAEKCPKKSLHLIKEFRKPVTKKYRVELVK